MSRIIERALSIINDNLKDQTSSFADPISIKPMARGGRLLEDEYPTHYLPHVGRQVMADGGAPVKGFEGRVSRPPPVEEPVTAEGVEAYHGSPHEFEAFDPAKIGTGEGAQAYGHGLYFAENPEVAQAYRSRLAGRPEIKGLTLAGHTVGPHNSFDYSPKTNSTYENLRSSLFEDLLINEDALLADPSNVKNLAINTLKERMKDLPDEWPEAVPHAEKLLKDINRANGAKLKLGETPGKMYEVRLNMGPEHLLHWDQTIKDQQAYNAVRKHWDDKVGDPDIIAQRLELNDQSTGEDLYNALSRHQSKPEAASKMLSNIGVRGIRYLDAGSRGQYGHTGSHNIVVFDPQHIKIKRKYAKGGEIPHSDDEGIVAYAFGNSIPHLDKIHDEIPEALPQKSYGGAIIPGPKLTEENADDFARRLIAWSFATAPLFHRADGGAVEDPVATAVDTARQINPMGFYSAAAEAVSKFPQKAPIDQIINKIKGQPNVKKEELDNANLANAFAGQRSVDPKEVARHLQENVPQIKETILSDNLPLSGSPAVKYEPKALLERPKGFENTDDVYEVGPNGKPPHLIAVNGNNFDVWGPSGYHNSFDSFNDAVEYANQSIHRGEPTQYSEYTIPGGENYREVVMTLPNTSEAQKLREEAEKRGYGSKISQWPDQEFAQRYRDIVTNAPQEEGLYKSSHWQGVDNPLAHLRMSDRDNGKTLHLEELQSDWGQEGRKKGFSDDRNFSDEDVQEFKSLNDRYLRRENLTPEEADRLDTLADAQRKYVQGVPSAPYVTDTNQWVDLGLKRALMEAAKGGYDKLIWTPGEAQADRYDLSKRIKKIAYDPDEKTLSYMEHGRLGYETMEDIPGNVEPHEIENHIGKEAASRLLATEPHKLSGNHILEGEDLKGGGKGMKSFYDKLVPQRLNKLVAQYDKDVKVAPHSHSLQGKDGEVKAHAIQITPKLREAILKGGLPAFEKGGSVIDAALDVVSKLRR